MQRSRAARERIYAATATPIPRSSTPHASIVADDLSTLDSESVDSISTIHLYLLLAGFLRAETPRDEEVLLVTTHFTHSLTPSLLPRPQPPRRLSTPLRFGNLASLILFDHSFRQSPFAVPIPNRAPFLPQPLHGYATTVTLDFDFPGSSDEGIEA
jgi:hypothetical protein